MKIAIIQMNVTAEKEKNLQIAREAVLEAARNGAELAVLPEMFCCPYSNAAFPQFAEPAGGRIWTAMRDAARDAHITLAAGSMPESDGGVLYNTCFVFAPDGKMIARHRKMHMFDIYLKNGKSFRESDTLSPGSDITLFTAGGHTFGLCICFDIRFPELFRMLADRGAEAVIIPAAFNMKTGHMHWELCFRSRAVDNQMFTIGAAPARDISCGYVSYANSIVCDPWANVIARAGTDPCILYADLDFGEVASVRAQLPLLSARRKDIY